MMNHDAYDPLTEAVERPGSRAGGPTVDAAGRRRPIFLEPAPLVEVLTEQIEYLVGHLAERCPPRCPECARLERAMLYLLRPFR
ncbi:MAG TPA: hypothetical protein VHA11_13185 [Bryobacteraceae bacterium]|jgi:hypothetical protein|nr:hypothetical protein [Bryobacteraceae bacterium]